ncbi:N-acetylglucosamine-6-sulfatase-like [Elysia marginata]|uniref:N-acetylglucosamine-6-sulfatase-like n=1 Tax=Elysia marginata TaxID=1093978 RepID=A0AAV4HTK6_9GAST|nr:N-acetylglucosamine-6-sulfatase-like [Elysia marginata]
MAGALIWTSLCVTFVILAFNTAWTFQTKQPNIVFVLTDDQDVVLFGQQPMPKTHKLLTEQGILFKNMFVSSPLCCPSRASILSGQFVHNHNTHNNSALGGCSGPAWQNQVEPKAFVTYLKAEGYRTFFAGKYLNQYGFKRTGGVEHVPPGWDEWHGLVGNSVYYNYSLSVNGVEEKHGNNYTEDYLTDVIHHRGLEFLSQQSERHPFFMMLSTPSCHAPFTPAPQYEKEFQNEKAPRTKSFNVHGKDKHWLVEAAATPMADDVINLVDNNYRQRHRTLLSVDDMVEGVYNKLKAMDLLDNTYIFFSSDNGFHLGQFSLPNDKRQPYEFDIRVPLIVRGPGIKPNTTSEESVTNVDLAPTFVDLSGSKGQPHQFDGMSFARILHSETHQFRSTVLVEYYGEEADKVPECPQFNGQHLEGCYKRFHCICQDSKNNTYGCIRYDNSKESFKFCEFQDTANTIEVYDLKADPDELTNIAKTAPPQLLSKLTDKLAKLSLCKGKGCHDNTDL